MIRIYRGRRPDQGRPGFSSLWKEFTKPWKNCTGKLNTLFSGQPGGGMNMICLGPGSSVNECGPLNKQAEPQRLLFLTWATLPCTAAHLGKLETLIFFPPGHRLHIYAPRSSQQTFRYSSYICIFKSIFYEHKASLCVSVSVSICVYICMPLCVYMSTYAHLCVYVCALTYVHPCVCMSVCLHMCTPVSVSLFLSVYMYTSTYIRWPGQHLISFSISSPTLLFLLVFF